VQRFLRTILISVGIHLVLFIVIAIFVEPELKVRPRVVRLEFDFEEEAAHVVPETVTTLTSPPVSKNLAESQPAIPPGIPISEDTLYSQIDSLTEAKTIAPNVFEILTANTDELKNKRIRRQLLYDEYETEVISRADSVRQRKELLARNFKNLMLKDGEIRGKGAEDRIGNAQNARNLGANPGMIDLPGLVSGVANGFKKFFSDDNPHIKRQMVAHPPSLTEISVLNQLWKSGSKRDYELFVNLDTTLKITLQDLNQILSHMTQKGWLSREKVSPENLFTIATPVGAMQIEMSKLNRKNPVFEYQPRVRKYEVLTALDIALNRFRTDSSSINEEKRQKLLKERIDKMLEE